MNIRKTWLYIVPVLFFSMQVSLSAEAKAKRPNILFAFADDWGRYASAYGKLKSGGPNDVVKTPVFDQLASEGLLFNNAFVNAPSCTPCRSSLLSGQYFWRTGLGAILQGATWDTSIPTYPLILKDNGYHIGHTYKVWSPGSNPNAPYGAKKYAYNRRGTKFNRFSQFVSGQNNQELAKQKLYDEVRGNFYDFLADRKDGQPFCYWFGPINCHRTWIQGSGKIIWGLNPDDLRGKLPKFLPDVALVRQDFCDYLGEVQAFDAGLGVLLEELKKTGEMDNTIIVVSGDHGAPGFPNGKCNLYNFGVEVPLVIRWAREIKAGRIVDDFVNLPDLAPTFLEAAGITPPKIMTGRSLLNVMKSKQQGLVDSRRDYVVVGRERHVAAARIDNLPYPQRAIRTAKFLYIRNFKPNRWPMGVAPGYGLPAGEMPTYEELEKNTFAAYADFDASPTKAWVFTHRDDPGMMRFFNIAFGRHPAEELYDLKTDPDQLGNVARNPEYAAVRKELSTRLLNVLQETNDPRVTGSGDTFDKSPYSDEYKRKRKRKR